MPVEYCKGGTLLVCCGSGVTLAGLLNGLNDLPARIVAVSSGRSLERIKRCVKRYVTRLPSNIEFVPAQLPYSTLSSWPCPFPTHPNYDLKVWQYLDDHIDLYADPILFWNIGA